MPGSHCLRRRTDCPRPTARTHLLKPPSLSLPNICSIPISPLLVPLAVSSPHLSLQLVITCNKPPFFFVGNLVQRARDPFPADSSSSHRSVCLQGFHHLPATHPEDGQTSNRPQPPGHCTAAWSGPQSTAWMRPGLGVPSSPCPAETLTGMAFNSRESPWPHGPAQLGKFFSFSFSSSHSLSPSCSGSPSSSHSYSHSY